MPPIMAPGPGSGGKNRLSVASCSLSCCHPTAGCTTTSRSPLLNAMILFMREKLMDIPPRVGVKWPSRLVPPLKAVTGIFRAWQTFMILETSSVEAGYMTAHGLCSGFHWCVDQSEVECRSRSPSVSARFSSPTIAANSAQAFLISAFPPFDLIGREVFNGSVERRS